MCIYIYAYAYTNSHWDDDDDVFTFIFSHGKCVTGIIHIVNMFRLNLNDIGNNDNDSSLPECIKSVIIIICSWIFHSNLAHAYIRQILIILDYNIITV